MSETEKRCTCPSGDGSLRWPCPSHPAAPSAPQGGGVGDVVLAARNAETTIRNCVAAGQIGSGYAQYADDLRDAVAALTAQPRPDAAQQGWIAAVDRELVDAHLGVANADDDVDTARRKLATLIDWHVAVATDPAVNGGFKLVPVTAPPSAPAPVAGDAVAKLLQAWDTSPTKAGPDWIEKNARRECAHQLRAALAQDRASQAAAPSAPVEVEAAKHWHSLYRKECQLRQDDAARYGQQIVELEALAQQPAAVDEATVERALAAYLRRQEDGESLYGCVTAALTAALAGQQQENGNG